MKKTSQKIVDLEYRLLKVLQCVFVFLFFFQAVRCEERKEGTLVEAFEVFSVCVSFAREEGKEIVTGRIRLNLSS